MKKIKIISLPSPSQRGQYYNQFELGKTYDVARVSSGGMLAVTVEGFKVNLDPNSNVYDVEGVFVDDDSIIEVW